MMTWSVAFSHSGLSVCERIVWYAYCAGVLNMSFDVMQRGAHFAILVVFWCNASSTTASKTTEAF